MKKFMLYCGDEKIGEAESYAIESGEAWEYFMRRKEWYYFRTPFSKLKLKAVNGLDLKYGDLVELEILDK